MPEEEKGWGGGMSVLSRSLLAGIEQKAISSACQLLFLQYTIALGLLVKKSLVGNNAAILMFYQFHMTEEKNFSFTT